VPRCACIDIGSNTTRLLVGEDEDGAMRELLAQRAFTKLISARGPDGAIAAGKLDEIAAVVALQVRLAQELGVSAVRVVGTAAIRDSSNPGELAEAIAAACGARLEVLSADDEARLAFAGAIGMLADPPPGELGVVDVGGGSTELVVGTALGGVTWSVSLPVGSGRITETDLRHDPPSVDELTELRARLARTFAEIDAPRPARAYAVGGSATSLQRLIGGVLEFESLARGLSALTTLPSAELAPVLGLHPERVRLLPAAIILLDAASRTLNAPLQMGLGGLREGIVLEGLAGAAGR
jgi:exopolyphosphatase/guanosine-5'-triphosphate,3'-diphosphate pyrophosphatase